LMNILMTTWRWPRHQLPWQYNLDSWHQGEPVMDRPHTHIHTYTDTTSSPVALFPEIKCSILFVVTIGCRRCLLRIDKVIAKDKTYIWLSVWWKTKN
jgi:hypothetical protein